MNMLTTGFRYVSCVLVIIGVLFLVACGVESTTPSPTPQPTVVSGGLDTMVPSTSTPQSAPSETISSPAAATGTVPPGGTTGPQGISDADREWISNGFSNTIALRSYHYRLKLDDPELDPIWSAAARLNIAVMMHVGDPAPFWDTFDYSNERYLEMALFPNRRCPPFEELMGERDRLFKKHPKTKFVAAHFGWHANDLGRLSRMFEQMPNVYVETGAILYDLGRQPRFAHDFFVKYQDRVMFGKDSFAPDEYPYFWRTFETADEYFDYYRDYHAFWKLYGIGLPDQVLRKLYYQNALKVTPGLSHAGFTN